MTAIEKLQEKLQIEIMDFNSNHVNYELEISTRATADGYDVYVITNDPYERLDWENDVYYYQPSFDDIINRIKDLDEDAIVYVSDFETYLPEYEVADYLEQHEEELQDEHEA